MSKLAKIWISIIIGLIAILGISNISNAYYSVNNLYVGKELDISYGDYASNSNIFCMEHGQSLTSDNYYKVVSNVKINGTKSTDHTGKTIDHKDNAKFAYILWCSKNSSQWSVANSVWNFGYKWINSVGQNHAGLYKGFASSVTGASTSIDTAAETYANSIINARKTKAADKTDKSKINVKAYKKDDKQYVRVGPFKWEFSGNLADIKAYDQDSKVISNILVSIFSGTTEKYIASFNEVKSNKEFYISLPVDSGVNRITKLTGKINLDEKTANIFFLESKSGYKQNLLIVEPGETKEPIDVSFDYDIPLLGNLKVIKVNKNNEIVKLSGVGFYVQNANTKKYVKIDNNETTYVENREDATEFITDSNGEITIKNLIVGDYIAYETKNPNYGYEIIKDGIQTSVIVDKTEELKIPNKQKYVKLSGYVWVDKISGKQTKRNDLYHDGEYDGNDILLDGITVKLKNRKTNEVVNEAKTSNGGAYKFVDVLVDELQDYYIEFEYDGLTYTNVIPTLNKPNGSKSAEDGTVRENFNNNFSAVTGKTRDTGVTLDSNGNEKYQLSYIIDENAHTATLDKTKANYFITATTDVTKFSIWDQFEYGQEEVKNINLGLYEREMPYVALIKDIENVKMTINGKAHVYQYAQRYINEEEYKGGFNVGIKFGEKYGNMSYTRPIYKADYEYETADKTNELKMYITYKLQLENRSGLKARVNSIVDYYDSRYKSTPIQVGTGVEQGNITGTIGTFTGEKYNDKYSRVVINSNTEINPESSAKVFVQFELDRAAILNLLNGKENLENIAEINSYSIFDKDGKTYAGVDRKSNPGNAVPGDEKTYEDDTDKSPNLGVELTDAREISGKVFLDETTGELKTGETRQGDGKYTDNEKGISGVKVTLTENTGSGKVYETTTDDNGNYTISGFIPGDYTLTYTWGDETYTVQKYKGTIYDASRNQNNGKWYKENVDLRLTDALDNYNKDQEAPKGSRLQIDAEEAPYTRTKMDSTTPTMDIGVEYESTYTASTGDKYVYEIKNIDFGIVERARQRLDLDKKVRKFKVTLANGQVIVDVTVNDDGTLSGEKNHVTYMGPTKSNNEGSNGFIRLELDNELIQGAKVEVQYDIIVTNSSELDYLSEEYYKYGIVKGDVVTITPTKIVDYLDTGWAFESGNNAGWEVKELDAIKAIKKILTDSDYADSTIAEKTLLYTESLKTIKLEPRQSGLDKDKYSRTLNINVSKVLANSDEISLDNEVEVAEIDKNGGAPTDSIPGNYIPGKAPYQEPDDSMAPTVIVTPNTGDNLNFIIPVIVGVVALVILGVGVILIKKKTL